MGLHRGEMVYFVSDLTLHLFKVPKQAKVLVLPYDPRQ